MFIYMCCKRIYIIIGSLTKPTLETNENFILNVKTKTIKLLYTCLYICAVNAYIL